MVLVIAVMFVVDADFVLIAQIQKIMTARQKMWFEFWLEDKGYDLKKLSREEGRELYRQFGKEMTPAVRDCTKFLNTVLKKIEDEK